MCGLTSYISGLTSYISGLISSRITNSTTNITTPTIANDVHEETTHNLNHPHINNRQNNYEVSSNLPPKEVHFLDDKANTAKNQFNAMIGEKNNNLHLINKYKTYISNLVENLKNNSILTPEEKEASFSLDANKKATELLDLRDASRESNKSINMNRSRITTDYPYGIR